MYLCTYVPMFLCTYVLMHLCTYAPMYLCTYVSITSLVEVSYSLPSFNIIIDYVSTLLPQYHWPASLYHRQHRWRISLSFHLL